MKVPDHSLVMFAHLLALLTPSFAPPCMLRSRTQLRSLVCSLAQFTPSRARGTVNDWMDIYSVFFFLFWTIVLWCRTTKNRDVSTGPFARLLAELIHMFAPHCLLCSPALLRSFVHSLDHSLTPKLVGKYTEGQIK